MVIEFLIAVHALACAVLYVAVTAMPKYEVNNEIQRQQTTNRPQGKLNND